MCAEQQGVWSFCVCFRPRAFRALKEALKCEYENWRLWENNVIVSVHRQSLSSLPRTQANSGATPASRDVFAVARLAVTSVNLRR